MARLPHLLGIVTCLALTGAPSQGADPADRPAPPALGALEDAPAPLPRSKRGSLEQERIEAASQLAAGRLLFQREEFAGALRHYQRAWRFDPSATKLLRDIIGLGFQLDRRDEAARYAVIQAEVDQRDPAILVELGNYLTLQGEWRRALSLFAKAVELTKDKPLDAEGAQLRLRMGRLYFLIDEYDKAADAFAEVRPALEAPEKHGLTTEQHKELFSDEAAVCRLMGEAMLMAERLEDAQAMLERAHRLAPNEGRHALDKARLAHRRGDTAETLANLEAVFAAKFAEAGAEPYTLLEQAIAKQAGNEDGAKEHEVKERTLQRLEAAYQADTANQQLAAFYADKLVEAERLEAAEKVFRQMLADRETADAYRGLAMIARRQGDAAALLDTLGQAVAKTRSGALFDEELKEIAEDAELAGKLLEAAQRRREAKSLSEGASLAAALVAMRSKRFDLAEELFLAAAAPAGKAQKAQTLLTWGVESLRAEQYEAASRAFRRAIDDRVAPDNNATFYYQMAGALELAGRTDDALAAARRAAELSPDEPLYPLRPAWVMHHAKRYQEAKQAYEQVLRKFDSDRSSPDVRDSVRDMRVTISALCVRLGQLDEAEEWLQQALDEFPEDPGALNDLGYLWADRDKYLARALEMTRRAVEAEPENAAYLDSLGWALFRLGRFDEAVEQLEKAVAHDEEPDGVILDHLADAYHAQQSLQKAAETWRKAAEAFRKQDDAEKLREVEAKLSKMKS